MIEQQLNELSIFSLRELARRTGVNSPTSKKKQQLIDEIVAINNGVKKPHIPKTKQGRPPKTFGYDVSNIFADKTSQVPTFSKNAVLNQECESFQHLESPNLSGIVEIVSNNVGFLWINKLHEYDCYFIPANIVEKFNIKSGDQVDAEICYDEDGVIVQDILKINGVQANKLNLRKDYFNIEHSLEKSKIEISNSNDINVFKGENTYFYGKDNNINTNYAINLLNCAKVESKIYVNVSIAEKNKHILKNVGAELFVSKITDDLETSRRIVSLAVERAIRLFEQDKHVLIVVDDALSVASVDNQELSILKRLMSITKYTKNASISIVAIMDEDKQINQIEKLADNKIKI